MGEGLKRAIAATRETRGEHSCCGQVWVKMGRWGEHQLCGKTAKFDREGKWYCGIHDPERLKAKSAERIAKWQAEWERYRKRRQREEAAWELLELCEEIASECGPMSVYVPNGYGSRMNAILQKAREAK
jgi:hypothetical protein